MNDVIVECLGDRWAMFYQANMPVDQLYSVQTLEQSIELVNHYLKTQGPVLQHWPAGMQDQAARLLWVNWIYQNLSTEPIRKPILTHYQSGRFYVDCGDTRLMSLRLYDPGACVAVITTCRLDQVDQFVHWTQINHADDLRRVTNFSDQACVLARPADNWCFSWLEIGDQTTAHHLHSVDQRVSMLETYINQQPADFKFSIPWARSAIDWAKYQTID